MSPLTAPPTHLDIQLASQPRSAEARAKLMAAPGFGKIHTDHMVVIPYSEDTGWGRGTLQPYGPIELDPAASSSDSLPLS